MNVRPLSESDVSEAILAPYEALPVPEGFDDGQRMPGLARRTSHLLATAPEGSWVAEDDGAIIGMANAIVRDGIWGLSMLAVRPDRHARGAGTLLLNAALRCAEGTRGQLIMSSQDPKAMRLYARAGFALLPGVTVAGIPDRTKIPAGLTARETADLEAAARLAVPVRGGAYDPRDLALSLERPNTGALMIEGSGFVLHWNGSPILLVADTDEAATDLLWSALALAPSGGTVDLDPLIAGQDWAIQAGLEAGLALTPSGPMFVRGTLGPLRPWLPSGALL